jgi:hypothetical protein
VRKISLTVVIAEPLHGGVDDFAGIFRSLLGEMEIDHGGFQVGMSHVSLDDSGVDTGFQKMGSVAMPESVHGHAPLGNTGRKLGPSLPPLPRAGKIRTGFL